MKRSILNCVGLVALALCSVVAAVAYDVAVLAVNVAIKLKTWGEDLFAHAMAIAPAKAGELHREPMKRLTAAKQFVLRFIKREAPVIESRWRACPSV